MPGVHPLLRFPPAARYLLLTLIVAALYAPGLDGAYFGDDLMFFRPLAGSWLEPFRHANRETGWYRPLEAVILGALQRQFGMATLPIHALALALHVTGAVLVAHAARALGLGSRTAFAAALTFAVSQASASAVLGNDTLSQILCTLLGLGAALLLGTPAGSEPGAVGTPMPRLARAVAGALALFAALLAKEAGIAWAAVATLAVLLDARRARRPVRGVLVPLALIAFAVVGYLLLRNAAGARPPAIGSSRYDLDPGPGVAGRLLLLLGVTVLPVSSVLLAAAWLRHAYALVVAGCASALAVGLACSMVWWRAGRARTWSLITVAALLVLGPFAMLGHVSELYAYSAMPFAAMVVGGAVTEAWTRAGRSGRAGIAISVALMFGLHVAAIRDKAARVSVNGRRAAKLLAAIEPAVAGLPRNGTLLLVTPRGLPPRYSIYVLNGFEPVEFSEGYLRRRTARGDVHVRIVTAGEAALRPPATAALTLHEGRIAPWRGDQEP